jgi:mRNA interferase RelE/StbE
MWEVKYLTEAVTDMEKLDRSQRIEVVKKINQVAANPLPKSEGGYGEPLGSRSSTQLTGYCKIKFLKLGLRVIYYLVKGDKTMKIVVVSARSDDEVYLIAQKRKLKK